MDVDNLFMVKNNYYIGAYQAAIAEAANLDSLSSSEAEERDIFVYRSYIELGSYELPIKEINESSPQSLQAIKLLAQYESEKINKVKAIETVKNWLADPLCNMNPTVVLVAGLLFVSEGDYVEALKTCHSGVSLEVLALSVQILLYMQRVDQAEKQLKLMIIEDEDAALTQLATAWVNLQQGGAKVQDAFFIYQEIGGRFSWTAKLYNASAVCKMKMAQWEDAEEMLQGAFEKDPKSTETIANLICVSLHLGKNATKYLNQLKAVAPQHPIVESYAASEELFNTCASGIAAS